MAWALAERVLAILGRSGQVEGVLALAVMVVERQRTDHRFTPAVAVGHRDHGPVEARHDGGDAAGEPGQCVLPVLFFGRGDVAHPLGHVLDVGGGDLAPMVLLKVRLHGARVELRILVTDLAGEQRRGAADDPGLLLERAVDAPATRGLVDVALDLDHPVGRLVGLGVAPTGGELQRPDSDRAAVGVETLQRLLGGTMPHRVARLLDRPFHLQQRALEVHRHLERHLRPRASKNLRHATTFSRCYRWLQHTSRHDIVSRPHPV
jgi:hypothetical protein